MKVSGTHVLHAPRERVWEALADPGVLAGAIPGCETLRQVATGTFAGRVQADVAATTGTYDGRVEVTAQDAPSSCALRVTGSGAPGTVDAAATVRLRDGEGGTTIVEYEVDAVVGGAVGGVGTRVLAGVARRHADAFLGASDRHLGAGAGVGIDADADARTGAAEAQAADADAGTVSDQALPGAGAVAYRPGPARLAGLPWPLALVAAALAGAAIALLGVRAGRHGAP